jgi:hypothetical protein
MVPVKACDSLKAFENIHHDIAIPSLVMQSVQLSDKFSKIDGLDAALFETIKGIREEIASNEVSLLKLKQPYMFLPALPIPEKTITSSILQLRKRLENIYTELKILGVDISNIETSKLPPLLAEYKKKFVKSMTDKISNGDYSSLFSSLPAVFFIDTHVPNTFTCAFTLDNSNIFVKNTGKNLVATSDSKESFVSTSGDGDEDFFKSSLLVQSRAIGGSIPVVKMKPVSNTPVDLYRHSEQRSFTQLGIVEFIKSVVATRKEPVKEIIFHGNTLRDMCSNCRATLVAHEMLATRNVLMPGSELPDSFLCALQEAFFTKFNVKPIVTCIISSFIEYEDRKKDSSWCLEPFINPLDVSAKASKGICLNFVNQFAFPEKDFLALFVPILNAKMIGETANFVVATLNTRFSILQE